MFALFGAAVVLFNFPMLTVFDRDTTIFGLPFLAVALFAIWSVLVGLLVWICERRPRQGGRRHSAEKKHR